MQRFAVAFFCVLEFINHSLPHFTCTVSNARGGADTMLSLLPARLLSPHGLRGWEHAPMKQSEARILIIEQWDQWISTRPLDSGSPTGKDSLKFFHELQDAKSPLLDFQSRGQDKWRIIHAWLLDAERLSDHWISPAPRIVPGRRPRPTRNKFKARSCGGGIE